MLLNIKIIGKYKHLEIEDEQSNANKDMVAKEIHDERFQRYTLDKEYME